MTKDTKVSEFTESTSILYTDAVPFIYDPSGAPRTRRAQANNFFAGPGIVLAASDASDNWKKHADYVCDGTADDVQAQSAFTAAETNVLHISPGTFYIDSPVILPDTIDIRAAPGAIFKANSVIDYVIRTATTTSSNRQIRISDLRINGNSKATNCLALYHVSLSRSLFSGVTCYGALDDGIYAEDCLIVSFRGIDSTSNGGSGIALSGCAASSLYSPRCSNNTVNGIEITPSATNAGNVYIYGPDIESNTENGISIDSETLGPVVVNGGWFEGNILDQIYCKDSLVVAEGIMFSYAQTGVTNAAIHLAGTRGGAWIAGCRTNPQTATPCVLVLDDTGAGTIGYGRNWSDRLTNYSPFTNGGAATSVADAGSIDHGMGVAPSRVFVQATVSGEFATVPSATITTAHFHVDIKKNDGTAGTTQTIYWRAEV